LNGSGGERGTKKVKEDPEREDRVGKRGPRKASLARRLLNIGIEFSLARLVL